MFTDFDLLNRETFTVIDRLGRQMMMEVDGSRVPGARVTRTGWPKVDQRVILTRLSVSNELQASKPS